MLNKVNTYLIKIYLCSKLHNNATYSLFIVTFNNMIYSTSRVYEKHIEQMMQFKINNIINVPTYLLFSKI